MKVIRGSLILASVVGAVGIVFAVLAELNHSRYSHPDSQAIIIAGAVVILLILNVYCLASGRSPQAGRLRRIWNLWLDAKEQELRARAKKLD
jgi:hypothetical protein